MENSELKEAVERLKAAIGESQLTRLWQAKSQTLDDFLLYIVEMGTAYADYGRKRGYADGWLMAAEFARRKGYAEAAAELKEVADRLEEETQKEDFEMQLRAFFTKDIPTD